MELGVADLVDAGDALDPRLELAAFYQAANVCVQASREEGLGFSPLEAFACGTPVVATAVGGLLETVVDGETGWTYPRGDSARLADAISDVLSHPEEAFRRTARGRAIVLRSFERAKTFEMFEEAVEKIGSTNV